MRTVVWLDALSVEMDDHGMVVRQYVHVCGAFAEMTMAVAMMMATVPSFGLALSLLVGTGLFRHSHWLLFVQLLAFFAFRT